MVFTEIGYAALLFVLRSLSLSFSFRINKIFPIFGDWGNIKLSHAATKNTRQSPNLLFSGSPWWYGSTIRLTTLILRRRHDKKPFSVVQRGQDAFRPPTPTPDICNRPSSSSNCCDLSKRYVTSISRAVSWPAYNPRLGNEEGRSEKKRKNKIRLRLRSYLETLFTVQPKGKI